MALVLKSECDRAIRAHGSDGYPDECCGALIGSREDGRVLVVRTVRMRNMNTERARDRFTLDPRELMQVERSADREGLSLLGFYHSHPDSPARPSLTDLSFAEPWPGLSWVILSVPKGQPAELRSWVVRSEGGQFAEEPVEVAP